MATRNLVVRGEQETYTERTREITRMLAGEKITDSALVHAAEMLLSAAATPPSL